MRIEQSTVEAFTIYDANRLDPVLVMLQDLEPGQGRIIIECYGESWSTYFSAMGKGSRLREFLRSVSPDYLANRMRAPHHKDTKVFKEYLERIVTAVLEALKQPRLETSTALFVCRHCPCEFNTADGREIHEQSHRQV